MINGVLQKLNIVEQTEVRLTLREYPIGQWLAILALLIISLNTAIWGFWFTAAVSVGIALVVGVQGEIRLITFDVEDNHMTIHMQSPIRRRMVNRIPLHHLNRAYLNRAETEHTQIVLVSITGDEMGLSVYSRDVRPWKDTIVFAINAILHEAHKDTEFEEALV